MPSGATLRGSLRTTDSNESTAGALRTTGRNASTDLPSLHASLRTWTLHPKPPGHITFAIAPAALVHLPFHSPMLQFMFRLTAPPTMSLSMAGLPQGGRLPRPSELASQCRGSWKGLVVKKNVLDIGSRDRCGAKLGTHIIVKASVCPWLSG